MRFAVLGRTHWLLDAAKRVHVSGHRCVAVITAKERPEYRATVDDFRAWAEQAGAAFLHAGSKDQRALTVALAAARPDIVLSMNWPAVLNPAVLAQAGLGIVNFHLGDLPRYRGNACPNWAILLGEARIALTAHQMAGQLDAGDIFIKRYLDVNEQTYIGDVYAWADATVPEMALDLIEGLANGRLAATPQPSDPALALRCYPRRPEDGRIDWSQPAKNLCRLVRASSRPFAGAFSGLRGRQVTIWRAFVHRAAVPFLAIPGQIMGDDQGDPLIACGDEALRLQEIELEGSANPKDDLLADLRDRLR